MLAAIEEDLINTYGEGEMHVRKCDTCNYEQVMHSAGVHSSGSSVKVYSDADEFSCPNCNEEEIGSGLIGESKSFTWPFFS